MLFKWTEFEARKNRLIMRGAVLTGVELSGDDSISEECVDAQGSSEYRHKTERSAMCTFRNAHVNTLSPNHSRQDTKTLMSRRSRQDAHVNICLRQYAHVNKLTSSRSHQHAHVKRIRLPRLDADVKDLTSSGPCDLNTASRLSCAADSGTLRSMTSGSQGSHTCHYRASTQRSQRSQTTAGTDLLQLHPTTCRPEPTTLSTREVSTSSRRWRSFSPSSPWQRPSGCS